MICSVSLSTLNLAHRHILLLTEAEERAIELVSCCHGFRKTVQKKHKVLKSALYIRRGKNLKTCRFLGETFRKL